MVKRRILIDIGSTFTKALAVDMEQEIVVAAAASPTTVQEDITRGIQSALEVIERDCGFGVDSAEITACSSAAGGLRMVSIGLIPELSSEAAKRAALGAGAKIIGHYCHQMTRREIKEIEAIAPDIILLAGGTDGGNDTAILCNALMLSNSEVDAPILVAGNKCSYDRIEDMFDTSSKSAIFVENVMPEISRLEVQPCRDAIRETFI
ncbi:MAG TPA: glutamate mutase L, partial [Syntrophorhabdaceae bacterium]|nr:glutamate mutase L [Syntrophorhabdaceae bacterium]